MKNAARMRYAVWIAELRIIGFLNATGADQNRHICFSVHNQIYNLMWVNITHEVNAQRSNHMYLWAVYEDNVLFAPEIK